MKPAVRYETNGRAWDMGYEAGERFFDEHGVTEELYVARAALQQSSQTHLLFSRRRFFVLAFGAAVEDKRNEEKRRELAEITDEERRTE